MEFAQNSLKVRFIEQVTSSTRLFGEGRRQRRDQTVGCFHTVQTLSVATDGFPSWRLPLQPLVGFTDESHLEACCR